VDYSIENDKDVYFNLVNTRIGRK